MSRAAVFMAICLFAGGCLLGPPFWAAPGSVFWVERVDFSSFPAASGEGEGLAYVEGEVVAVAAEECTVRTEAGRKRFILHPECLLFVNGRRSIPPAMRPVAPDAFFWAGIWYRDGEAAAIEAVYLGGELIMLGASPEGLIGWSPERREVFSLPVRPGKTFATLRPGQNIYVLLDLEGRVRWVRVLDD